MSNKGAVLADTENLTENPAVRAALFDIDGTLTTGGEVWGALIKSPDVAGFRKVWLYGTAWPHYGLSKARIVSQSSFRDRWIRLMAWLTTGWAEEQMQVVYERTVQEYLVPTLRPDVTELLKRHKAQDRPVVLVSTMFEGVVGRLAEYLGADAGLGSRVEMQNGRCTGRIMGETCSGGRKVDFVRGYLAQRWPDILLDACAAYADSRSDIPFLAGIGYPVTVYPDDAMREAAEKHGWPVYTGGGS